MGASNFQKNILDFSKIITAKVFEIDCVQEHRSQQCLLLPQKVTLLTGHPMSAFGSKAEVTPVNCDVCFAPDNGQSTDALQSPLCATSRPADGER
jgi:hypothetical protein